MQRIIIRTLFNILFNQLGVSTVNQRTGVETADIPGGGFLRRHHGGNIGGRIIIGNEWVDWTDDVESFRVNFINRRR